MPLFIDFLHDHGHSELRVRVRVMPSCFLVLLEHTLTVQASARIHHTARCGTCANARFLLRAHPAPLCCRPQGVLSQRREVRYFHKFGDDTLLRTQRLVRTPLPPLSSAIRPPPAAAGPADELTETAEELALAAPRSKARAPPESTSHAPPVMPCSLLLPMPPITASDRDDATAAAVSSSCIAPDGALLAVGMSTGALSVLELPRTANGATEMRPPRSCSAHAHSAAVTAVQAFESSVGGSQTSAQCLVSSSEDGTCALWVVGDSHVESPPPAVASRTAEVEPADLALACVRRWSLDSPTADRASTAAGTSGRRLTPIVQLVACEPRHVDGSSRDTTLHFAAAVGESICLLSHEASARSHAPQSAATRELRAHGVVTAMLYAPVRRYLCASAHGGVALWSDFGRGEPLAQLRFFGPLDTMTLSHTDRYIACGALDSTLVMWPLPACTEANGGAGRGAVAPDRAAHESLAHLSAIVTAVGDVGDDVDEDVDEGVAAACSGAALFFGGYERQVGPVAFDPSGGLCASAGGRSPVLWRLEAPGAPTPVRRNDLATTLNGHVAPIVAVRFSPTADSEQGTILASADRSGAVLLFHVPEFNDSGDNPVNNPVPNDPGRTIQPSARCEGAGVAAAGEGSLFWGRGASGGWLFVVGAEAVRCYLPPFAM